MLARVHVVVTPEDEKVVEEVIEALREIESKFSYSPWREQPSLANCLEFFGTANLNDEEIDNFLAKINNDLDGERDDCSAYSFNTKMFHKNVYYIQFQIH